MTSDHFIGRSVRCALSQEKLLSKEPIKRVREEGQAQKLIEEVQNNKV